MRKLKIPLFEGEDAYGWIYRVERYFAVNGVTDEEKLMAVPLCLEGKSLAWFQWLEGRHHIRSWEEFKDLLLHRFRVSSEGTHYEQFLALVQDGTVAEYRERFELLSGRLRGISDDMLEGNFMKGLKSHIRAALRVARPHGLVETMELAQLIEDKMNIHQPRRQGTTLPNYRAPLMLEGPNAATITPLKEVTPEKDTTVVNPGGFKRLTDTEMKEKRARGLCYRCDERYAPGHRCKEKSLHVILVGDSDEEIEEGEERQVEEGHTHLDMFVVAVDPVPGLTAHPRMTLEGEIAGYRVAVLIDSGATHNFMACRVAEQAGLHIFQEEAVGVILGTGQKVQSQGQCRRVPLSLQGEEIVQGFFLLELGSTDIILGMQWLLTLGETKVNWKAVQLKYDKGGRKVILQGYPKPCRSKMSLKTILEALKSLGSKILARLQYPQFRAQQAREQQADTPLQKFMGDSEKATISFNLEDKVNVREGGIDRGRGTPQHSSGKLFAGSTDEEAEEGASTVAAGTIAGA